ncbi:zinc ribbon domain-containing protein [candidate division KSB1 bacterium]
MPIYEFECQNCNNNFEELFHKYNISDNDVKCPNCESNNIKRIISLFSSPGITKEDSCSSCTSSSCSSCSR